MAFHSFWFLLLFLPVVVILYRFLLPRNAAYSQAFLLAASAFFYVQSGANSALVLSASILANWFFAQRLNQPGRSGGFWFVAGLAFNVLLLCYFKYATLLVASSSLGSWLGLSPGWRTGFPLGVSFFTIQQIMYLVDVRQGMVKPGVLFDHALAVSFFPTVTSGPITSIGQLIKQFHKPRLDNDESDLAVGIFRFAVGLFKKAVLADTIAIVVGAGYGNAASLSMSEVWLSSGFFLLQLYLDFSGYSDMAIGIGRMMGFTVPENFGQPLLSTSISEFWQSWHMTLTSFITSYLYTPVVRALRRVTIYKAMATTVGAMAIAGIWHGSGWQFLIFGLLHGCALALHQGWKSKKYKMPDLPARILTFVFVLFAFLFFRAPDIATAWDLARAGLGSHAGSPWSLNILIPAFKTNWRITALLCAAAPLICFLGPTSAQYVKSVSWKGSLAAAVALLWLISLLFLNSSPDKGFIYAGF